MPTTVRPRLAAGSALLLLAVVAGCSGPQPEPRAAAAGDAGGQAEAETGPAAEETTPVTDTNGRTGTLVVANKGDDSAWLIDAATGERIASIPTGAEPHEVAVSPDGRRAVVSNYGRPPMGGNSLTILDLPGKRAERTIDLGRHRRPHGVAWLPDNRRIVVTAEVSRAVLVVDADQGTILSTIPTDEVGTHMLALSPDAKRVYTTNVESGTVTAVDLERGAAVGTARAGRGPEGFDLSPDGRELWVGNRHDHTVSVLDAATLRPLATLDAPRLPFRVDFTPDGRLAVVSTPMSARLHVFDVATRRLAAEVDMRYDAPTASGPLPRTGQPGAPLGVVVSGDGSHAFAANGSAPVVTVVDLRRNEVVAYFATGRGPDGIAWSPLGLK